MRTMKKARTSMNDLSHHDLDVIDDESAKEFYDDNY